MKRRQQMKRTRLARKKGLNPTARTKVQGVCGYDLDRAAKWHLYVTMSPALNDGPRTKRNPCVECGVLYNIEAHHIIAKQTIKKTAKTEGWDWDREQEAIWDNRNGIPLCSECHQRHEVAFKRVSRSNVPDAAVEFAAELGLGHLIDRYYPN